MLSRRGLSGWPCTAAAAEYGTSDEQCLRAGISQRGADLLQYRQLKTDRADELASSVPGGQFWLSPLAGGLFSGRHGYVNLSGVVLNHIALGSACLAVGGGRDRNSTVCSVIGPHAAMNGQGIDRRELTMVHPDAAFSLLTGRAATLHSFTLEPNVLAEFPELKLPDVFLGAQRPGRWKVTSTESVDGFVALVDAIFDQLSNRPSVATQAAARLAMRNAALERIFDLAEGGSHEPDTATVARHTRIMVRFRRALEETEPENLDILTLCRAVGTSRRSLEAIVRRRTGKSPWDYVRWRRLLHARQRLASPGPTTSVTRVAADLGVWHTGRFAREYATAFGEFPVETLNRARGRTDRGP